MVSQQFSVPRMALCRRQAARGIDRGQFVKLFKRNLFNPRAGLAQNTQAFLECLSHRAAQPVLHECSRDSQPARSQRLGSYLHCPRGQDFMHRHGIAYRAGQRAYRVKAR